MSAYILRRVLLALATIWLSATMVFLALRVTPEPTAAERIASQCDLTKFADCRRIFDKEFGLDKPLLDQYVTFMANLATGDLGNSFASGREPVAGAIKDRIGTSIELGLLQLITAIGIAVPVGVISAVRQDSWLDYGLRSFSLFWLAVPSFITAVFVLLSLSRWAGWTPIRPDYKDFFEDPAANMQTMIVPALIGGLASGAVLMRFIRTELLEVLRQDYVRTAMSKGLTERVVVLRHALRNAMIPVITVTGFMIAGIVSGNFILETLFVIPGVGTYAVQGLATADYPVIQGVALVVAISVVTVNLGVDLAYAWLDPRVVYS